MANGDNVKIPGFFVGGSAAIGVSNTAILVGALAIGVLTWMTLKNSSHPQKTMLLDGPGMEQTMSDVYAYAASPQQVRANHDRIRAAIQRAQSAFRVARDSFRKKLKDLVAARRAGTITNAQFKAQLRTAIDSYHQAIRLRWAEIHEALGIATKSHHLNNMVPTVP